MKCEEFRREYQSHLDARHPGDLPPEVAAHAAACRACAAFAAAMRGVDRAQREQPRISIPESLLADLLAIPLHDLWKEFTLSRYVAKGAALILPGIGCILLAMLILPPGPLFWVRFGVLTAGCTLLWVNALREPAL